MNMIVREPYKDPEFKDTNMEQLEFLADTIKNVRAFITMIKFSSETNEQTNHLFLTERGKLQV